MKSSIEYAGVRLMERIYLGAILRLTQIIAYDAYRTGDASLALEAGQERFERVVHYIGSRRFRRSPHGHDTTWRIWQTDASQAEPSAEQAE